MDARSPGADARTSSGMTLSPKRSTNSPLSARSMFSRCSTWSTVERRCSWNRSACRALGFAECRSRPRSGPTFPGKGSRWRGPGEPCLLRAKLILAVEGRPDRLRQPRLRILGPARDVEVRSLLAEFNAPDHKAKRPWRNHPEDIGAVRGWQRMLPEPWSTRRRPPEFKAERPVPAVQEMKQLAGRHDEDRIVLEMWHRGRHHAPLRFQILIRCAPVVVRQNHHHLHVPGVQAGREHEWRLVILRIFSLSRARICFSAFHPMFRVCEPYRSIVHAHGKGRVGRRLRCAGPIGKRVPDR